MTWLIEMTQTRKIDNVLYFNGKINNKNISFYEVYNKENNKNEI